MMKDLEAKQLADTIRELQEDVRSLKRGIEELREEIKVSFRGDPLKPGLIGAVSTLFEEIALLNHTLETVGEKEVRRLPKSVLQGGEIRR